MARRALHVLALLWLASIMAHGWVSSARPPLSPCRRARAPLYSTAPSSSSSSSSSAPTPASSPASAAAAAPAAPQQPPTLMEGDIVEYVITERQRQKGQLPKGDTRTKGLGVVNYEGRIHPLCQRSQAHVDMSEVFYDEEQDALEEPAEAIVTRVLSQVWMSSRIIEDRKINPHGEEAEDVYVIEEALSEGCGPTRRF